MAYPFLLLAAQAAGIATNIYAQSQQTKIGRQGLAIDQAQLGLRMEQETLAATQDTLTDLTTLQETLASQRAIFGARGQNPGQGTAKSIEQKSVNAYGADANARRINQTFKKSYMESLSRLKRVEQHGLEAQRGVQLLGQSLNMVDFNSLYGMGGMKPTTVKTRTR